MLPKKIVSLICLFTPFILFAQSYSILLLPDTITKNASVVKRYEEIRVEVKGIDKIKTYEKHVYTILNDAGDDFADYVTRYDKFTDVNNIDGVLYDAMGKELKSVKKKDIEDISGNSDESLMVDTRYKRHNFYYKSYPYTVSYEEEDDVKESYNIPGWFPQTRNIMSVQYSKYVITVPQNFKIRYRQSNFAGEPQIKEEKETITYTWELKNTTAKTYEPMQPAWNKIFTQVIVAPADFDLDGHKGSMASWESLSKFGYDLLQGRDVLPDAVKQKVHALTDNLTDPREKVNVLYTYLQQNTRYISIQLGIGGLQPFDANYVATKKYGDCKALSNYMVALLKEAGIKANSAWIFGGRTNREFLTDFPSDQFNHVVACVPMQKDSIWLECTSQTEPAGYNGGFTGNRYALLLAPDGGKLVSTTKYSADDNKQLRNITGTIDESGKLTASINTKYTCEKQDRLSQMINYLPKDKILERLKTNIDLPDYDVTDFNYAQQKSQTPSVTENIQVVANSYATVSGKRLFIMPNILNKHSTKLKQDDQRKYDIEFTDRFTDVDSINIAIPGGYNIEAMPKDVVLNNKFANYEIHFKVDANNISCTRYYKVNENRFPASDYAELVKFYDAMYKADRSKIVFVKKEG